MVRIVRQTTCAVAEGASSREESSSEKHSGAEAPRYVGDYQLLCELGRGGMGIVYKARQLSLNRVVALKVIAPEQLTSPKAVERFHTEAKAAANLDHPNIVPVHDTGIFEGRHYFSMRLIEGESLAARLNDFRLPLAGSSSRLGSNSKTQTADQQRRIARLIGTVADAVHYAHQRGVLHRDLKPGNILIDSAGEPHVTDFGLAKHVNDESGLTLAGDVLGTPAYMAPEQAAGKASEVTTTADLYSLGVILYELLTGLLPFRGKSSLDIFSAALHDEPAQPRILNRVVPPDLETICLKCLEKNPARRYTSARALAEDLRRFERGEVIQARRITQAERVWRWCRRKPAFAAFLLLFQITLVLGLSGILWQWHSARQAEFVSRENSYAADIGAAQRALEQENLRQAVDLLRKQIPKAGQTDLRGFEWRYLWGRCQSDELFSLPGHAGSATAIAFAPDGRTFATASQTRTGQATVKIWNETREQTGPNVYTQTSDVCAVSFSPDCRWLAVATRTGVDLYDTRTNQHIRSFPGCKVIAKFSPAGGYLLTACTNGLVLWNTDSWTKVGSSEPVKPWSQELADMDFNSARVAFSPDGTSIAVPADGGVRLYNVPDLRETSRFADRLPRIRFVNISPDGHLLAACTARDHNVKLWNTKDKSEVRLLSGHSDSVENAVFSPDGRNLATCSCDQTIKLWDLTTGEAVRTFKGHVEEVWDLAFSPDGKLLASVSKDGGVKVWDALANQGKVASLVDFLPLGFTGDQMLAGIRTNDEFTILDPESESVVRAQLFVGWKDTPTSVIGMMSRSLSRDGGVVVLHELEQSGKENLELWNLNNGRFLYRLEGATGPAVFSPDGRFLAGCTSNETVSVWRTVDGSRVSMISNAIPPIAFSPDGTALATRRGIDGPIELWKLEKSSFPHLGILGVGGVVEFSPKAALLASGTSDGVIQLWSMPSCRLLRTMIGHKRGLAQMSFSPDGRTLASVADDGTVRLWHVDTGRELLRFQISMEDVNGQDLLFSSDGRSLEAWRNDTRGWLTRVWPAPTLAEIAVAEGHEYRTLVQDALGWQAVAKALEKQGRFEEEAEALRKVIQRASSIQSGGQLRKTALRRRAKVLVGLERIADAATDNLAALGLASRDAELSNQSIDLSAYFNGTLDWNSLYFEIPQQRFLTELPRGRQVFPSAPGVEFDIRGVVQVNNSSKVPGVPNRVEGIQVGRKPRRLHFLHATHRCEASGTKIGRYIIHFADGKQEELPILYGVDIHDWVPVAADPTDQQGGKAAWQGHHRVYLTTWENPHPEVEIRSLDFVSEMTKCGPFLIALTAEN